MHPCSKKCSVPGCKDSTERRHRFPKNDPALFQKWLDQINNTKLTGLSTIQIYQRHRVCHRHFSDEFRITLPSRTSLRVNAYPTLFLSESQPTSKGISDSGENINLNSLASCLKDGMSLPKEVLQKESKCSTYEQFSDGENKTASPEYIQMEDQNQNDREVPISIIPGAQPGCSKQVSSIFQQTPEDSQPSSYEQIFDNGENIIQSIKPECVEIEIIENCIEEPQPNIVIAPNTSEEVPSKDYLDLNSVCRCCLQNENLRIMKGTMIGNINAIKCYEDITKRKVDLRIPAKICTNCIKQLTETQKFLKLLDWSDNLLHKSMKIETDKFELSQEAQMVLKDENINIFSDLSLCNGDVIHSSDDENPVLEKSINTKNNFKKWLSFNENTYVSRIIDTTVQSSECHSQICPICQEESSHLERHLNNIHHIDWLNSKCLKCCFMTHDKLKLFEHSSECRGDGNVIEGFVKYELSNECSGDGNINEGLSKKKSKSRIIKVIKQTKFNCNQCNNLSFITYEDIEAHYKDWHKSSLNCILCEQEFSNTYSVLYHMMVKHGRLKCCRLCLVSFKTKEELMGHYKSEEHNTKCVVCDEQFKNRKALYGHRRRKHLNPLLEYKKYKCPECSKEFVNKQNIKRHILVFHNNVRFLCDTCGQSYTTNRNLQLHITKFHKGQKVEITKPRKSFFCESCGRELKIFHKYAIALHMARHKGHYFVCKKCHESFGSKEELNMHIEEQNHQLFECTKCPSQFVREENLKIHMKNHDAPGWNKNYFIQYGKSAELRNEKGEFECSYCPKAYKIKQRLDNHLRVHTNERPYKCQFCQKAFKTWIHRKTHLNVHLGIKKWQCRFCQKAFTYSSTLKAHEMTHTGERPNKCPECYKGFISTSALKKHRQVHFRNSINCQGIKNSKIKVEMQEEQSARFINKIFISDDVNYSNLTEPEDQT
ncbi:uncharacterized protein LOC143190724 isoform X3 [Rhynchophorus ferrugineus]|uniref:uncharacterized protein LOC143190724 isoform X3 n=1 Tax=Rhynchophorus ferrugineus TaxID=354439 RepID=UPI003FCECA16